MPVFKVEVRQTAYVLVDSEDEAYEVALDNAGDIIGDTSPDVEVGWMVTKLSQLEDGWDGRCLPYVPRGDRKELRLEDVLEK